MKLERSDDYNNEKLLFYEGSEFTLTDQKQTGLRIGTAQLGICLHITKTRLFKYTEFFTTKKWKFSDEKFW